MNQRDAAPLVSVIVRSIGRPSLHAALDSIAEQTYRPIEIVLVDASGGQARPPQDKWADLVLRVPDTAGQALPRAAAANFGLQQAKGELALFLDDDDVLLPEHLKRLQQALAAAPEAPAAFADIDFGYPTHEGDGWHSLHRFEGSFDRVRLRFENFLPIHSVLFRLDANTPRVDPTFDLFEDWDFWLQMARRGDFVHVRGISARYVAGEGQRSGVFIDSAATRHARQQLFTKWQTASTPAEHAQMVERLQQLYREHAQGQASLSAAQAAQVHQQQLIAARETEMASMQEQAAGLRSILGARERELAEFAEHVRALSDLVKTREAECAEATRHAQSLVAVLSERDRTLIEATRHAKALTDVIAARDHELTEASRHANALTALVAARDDALAESTRYATALKDLLATRDESASEAARHAQALTAVIAERDTALAESARHIQGLTDLANARERDWAAAAAYATDLRQHLEAAIAGAADERQAFLQAIAAKDQELAELRTRLAEQLALPPLRAMVDAIQRSRTKSPR